MSATPVGIPGAVGPALAPISADMLKANILIVDDHQMNVDLLAQILGAVGYVNVTSTLDPFAVCDLHATHGYDLILLDLQMPGMDGFQVMEGLKLVEKGGYLPVLVITAQPDHMLRALRASTITVAAVPDANAPPGCPPTPSATRKSSASSRVVARVHSRRARQLSPANATTVTTRTAWVCGRGERRCP